MAVIPTFNNGWAEYATTHGFVHLDELPTLKTSMVPGSLIHVIEDGSKYVLDNNNKWCLLVAGCGKASQLTYKVVDELPDPEDGEPNVIYLVQHEGANYYDMYILSNDTFVEIGSTLPDYGNLVTKADLEAYLKKANLTDGSIERIIATGQIAAADFKEGGKRLEDKYLQKVDLERGTVNFDTIQARKVNVTEKTTTRDLEATGDTTLKSTTATNLTVNGTTTTNSLDVKAQDGITIKNKSIKQYILDLIKNNDGITEEELRNILPTILNTPVYQADVEETDITKPSYVWNNEYLLRTNKLWIGTKAQYNEVAESLPTDIYVFITDDWDDFIQEGSIIFQYGVDTESGLPDTEQKVGYLYIVTEAGTYDGTLAKVGDLFIVQAVDAETGEPTNWLYVPSGNDSQLGNLNVVSGELTRTGNGISGDQTFGLADTAVTAGTYGENDYTPAEETAGKKVLVDGEVFTAVRATVDSKGRITGLKNINLELPEFDANSISQTLGDVLILDGSI